MELWRLRTWLFLVAPLLTMLFSVTLSKSVLSDSSIDVSDIIDAITSGTRRVLLLTPTPLSQRVLVIVSSLGSKILDDGAIVFDQSPGTLTDTSLQLTESAQFFTNRWGAVPSNFVNVGVLSDSNNEYLAIVTSIADPNVFSQGLQLINLQTGSAVYQTIVYGDDGTAICQMSPFMADGTAVYPFDNLDDNYLALRYGTFSDTAYHESHGQPPLQNISLNAYLYHPGEGTVKIFYQTNDNPNENVNSNSVWYISADYITDSSVILVEAYSLSVIQFDKSILQMGAWGDHANASYTNTSFADYWIKPPVTTTSTTTTATPTADTSSTNADIYSTNPNTSASHSGKVQPKIFVHHHGNLALIIAISSVLGALFLASLIYCLLRKCRSNQLNATEKALAATEKMPKGDGKGGSRNKVANRKSSKRSGIGRASKGATASKGTNAPGEDQEPRASHQKIIKLFRRRGGSLKKTLSIHPVSSGKVPSTRRSSLSPHPSVQRRASSGKVASGRRFSLKRQRSSKHRVSSGKAATPHRASSGKAISPHHATPHRVPSGKAATPKRVSSGKAATPHHASSNRKGSIKRHTSGKASILGTKH